MNRAQRHYDAVTQAWAQWVMGEDLHFGLFARPELPLAEATRALTTRLADLAQLSPGLEVLDVGCGIGTAARYLVTARDCRVLGISTSAVGVQEAGRRAAAAGIEAERLRFQLADAMDNRLPDGSFDRVFSLESAHLMPDKDALFRECARVLRPGGRLALCDVCLVGNNEDGRAEVMRYVLAGHASTAAARMRDAVHEIMHRAFGSTRMTHHRLYEEAARAAGFVDLELIDVSKETRPTLIHWAENTAENAEAIRAAVSPEYVDDLLLALLHMTLGWGQLGGYVLMSARRG